MIAQALEDAVDAHRAGDLQRAHSLYARILQLDPQHADALHMLGLLAHQSGDLMRARALIEQSIRIAPGNAVSHYNLALVRLAQADLDGAIAAYEAAVAIVPTFSDAYNNLGNAYVRAGRHADAVGAFLAAIRAKPDGAAVYSNLASVLITLERFDEAIAALETALRLNTQMPEIFANLGQAYRRSGQFRAAIAAAQRAIELRPRYRDAYVNLAISAAAIGNFTTAREADLRALEIHASFEVHNHLSSVYHALGRYSEAIVQCEAAIALRPDFAEAHVNRAVSLLVLGDFPRGWEACTWMWRLPAKRARYPYLDRAELWNGESFVGRTLLITRDQGFGDALQMVRYLPLVKARGGRVVMEVAPPLVPLFANLPSLDEIRVHGDSQVVDEAIELHVPLSGLPRAFRTEIATIPRSVPYLHASHERVDRWRERFERPARLHVGLVWSGNPNHENDANRSCRIDDFAPLGNVDGIAWYSLQNGTNDDRRSCGTLTLEPLGDDIRDFADSAAILTHLDLVISVDTAIVHLAGAMGKTVWTLLAFAPDWRWLTERKDSPWYPTMRLFRQPRAGDWAAVIAEVTTHLRTFNTHTCAK